MRLTALLTLVLTVSVTAGTFFRLEVGPPVAGGTDLKIKNAVLVVRPLACDDVAAVVVSGTAEGIVNGARQSLPLTLVPLKRDGIHAVTQQWPADGRWVLHLTGACASSKAAASTIVPLTKYGFVRDKVQVLRERATKAQIDAALAGL